MNENTPTLQNIDQVSDGWIKKYVLTYELPDGSPHIYEAVSRIPRGKVAAMQVEL